MTPEGKVLKLGDPCSNCGGEYRKARQPTKEEHTRAFYGSEAGGLPPNTDTMDPDQVSKHGELYICRDCGHQTRFKPEEPAAPASRTSGKSKKPAGDAGDE